MLGLILGALKRSVLCMIGFGAFLVLMPNLPPYGIEFPVREPFVKVPFSGGLEQNHRLETAEAISSTVDHSSINYLKGAESFAVRGDYLYTGVQGGDILRLDLNNPRKPWEYVTKIGELCVDLHYEDKCGRPLGLEFDKEGFLIVCDAYYGLHRVNVDNGEVKPLLPASVEIDGKRNLVTNSLALTSDGKTVYFTTSSTNFDLSNGMFELMAAPSGRVLKYDIASNTTKVIMDELSFANGIALSKNEDFVVVCETGGRKLWRYWTKGEKRGQKEVFAHLPGAVDNVQPTPEGNFLVGVVVVNLPNQESLLETLMQQPWACKMLVRLCRLVQIMLDTFNSKIFHVEAFAVMIHRLGNTEHSGANMVPKYGLLVELDPSGQVVQSWHSSDPTLSRFCEGFLHKGYIYLGSPYNTYVTRLPYK